MGADDAALPALRRRGAARGGGLPALRRTLARRHRRLAGALIGSVGLAAEWGWTHVWMPPPWPDSLLPEAALAGLATAVAAGALGGFVGAALVGSPPSRGRRERRAALGATLVLVALVGWGLPISSAGPDAARVRLAGLGTGEATATATVRIVPATGLEDAHFLNVTAWQGGGSEIVALERLGPGLYRTERPVPVHGGWKVLVRLHAGDSLLGVPIHLPRDRAIPAAAVPARAAFTRPFVPDRRLLQRERKEGVAGWLSAAAYATVAAIAAALLALIAWALLRLADARRPGGRSERNDAEAFASLAPTPSPR